jgi:hypothetical protein
MKIFAKVDEDLFCHPGDLSVVRLGPDASEISDDGPAVARRDIEFDQG